MRFVLLLPFLLAACNTPTVKNFSAPSQTVTAQGFKFKVIYTSDQAEAFRIGIVRPRDLKRVQPAAVEAIARATGCTVNPASVAGDPAKVTADLAC